MLTFRRQLLNQENCRKISRNYKVKIKGTEHMNIRRILAVWAAKATGFACKKMGRQGVTWAGKIALKIYPPVLKELAGEVKK